MSCNSFIYFLSNPLDGIPKYIGCTIQPIKKRLNSHIQDNKNSKKVTWIKSLKNNGLKPNIEIIDIVNKEEIHFWEMHYISLYKSWGFELKNSTNGGEGVFGFKPTEICRKKSSERMLLFNKNKRFKNGEIAYQSKDVLNLQTGIFYKSIREAALYSEYSEYHLRDMLNNTIKFDKRKNKKSQFRVTKNTSNFIKL